MNKQELNAQLDLVEKALTDSGIPFDKANRSGQNKDLENELLRLENLLSDESDEDDIAQNNDDDADNNINQGDESRAELIKKQEEDDIIKLKVQIKKGLNIETKRLGNGTQVLCGDQSYFLPVEFAEELIDGGHAEEVEDDQ